MALGRGLNPFAAWNSDTPLVRPYVTRRHPEQAPVDAIAPVLAERCDRCPAGPLVILWRAFTKTVPPTAAAFPHAGAGVLELQFCGHHATAYEAGTDDAGWSVVVDHRQRAVDAETR